MYSNVHEEDKNHLLNKGTLLKGYPQHLYVAQADRTAEYPRWWPTQAWGLHFITAPVTLATSPPTKPTYM